MKQVEFEALWLKLDFPCDNIYVSFTLQSFLTAYIITAFCSIFMAFSISLMIIESVI